MPGITSVDLVEHGNDFVTIKTNEGVMKRTNISKRVEDEKVVLKFDEEYKAGSKITTKSHFLDEFSTTNGGITHRLIISDVNASGLLGFFYRNLGSGSIGNAFLESYKAYFEKQSE